MRAAGLLVALLVALPSVARAQAEAEVVGAFDRDHPFDVHAWIDYDAEWHRAAIQRERTGIPGADRKSAAPVLRDLVFHGTRHTVTPRVLVGVGPRLGVTLALPVVLGDSNTLELDDRGVSRANSTTILDGLLPEGGWDAAAPGGAGFPDGATIFRGVDRKGLDQLHVGLEWAPMVQSRDPVEPTWKLGIEGRFAIGKRARLDVMDPASENGVGRGVDEVRLWTSAARRIGRTTANIGFWWQGAYNIRDDSPFRSPGFGSETTGPMQRAGGRAGFDVVALDRPENDLQISVTGGASLETLFDGRDYTEMWEIFAFAGAPSEDGPLVLDADPSTVGAQPMAFPGISNAENYITLTAQAGTEVRIGSHVRIGLGLRYADHQGHLITTTEAGADLPTCGAGQTSGCENDDNVVVDPGTAEVNPLHVPTIDRVGHRYRVAGSRTYGLELAVRVLF